MKEILQYMNNMEWVSIVSSLLGVFSVIISVRIFKRKKDADKNLINLIKSDSLFFKEIEKSLKELERMQIDHEDSKKQLSKELNIDSEYKKIKTHYEALEMELLKLELLKKQIENLTNKLNSKDANEISEALNQKSMKGQTNYLNYILKRSGSNEQVAFEELRAEN